MSRIFLLSPANCSGRRAQQVLSPRAAFPLAAALRTASGAPLGDVFAFVSGLYFRGKLTYARRFAAPDSECPVVSGGVQVITPNAGLRPPDTRITGDVLRAFAGADVCLDNERYRRPFEQSARVLARQLDPEADVILLGSIASDKYVAVLLDVFGDRLRFPIDFVGRGDMSRGGLLLRRAAEGTELEYACVSGAVRRGARPPKLPPLGRPRVVPPMSTIAIKS
jgi:hypothetical protein